MKNYKKLYENALERARDLHDNHPYGEPGNWWTCEKIFPELKESEDEKIRKEILDFIIQYSGGTFNLGINDSTFKKWIAWLEKQGEKLPVGFYYVNSEGKKFYSDTFKYGDFTFHVEKQEEKKETLCDKCRREQPSHSCQDITALGRCALEHQSEQIHANFAKTCKDEQKPADKVEPKFHEGDWVVSNPELCFESPLCIKDIDNNNYRVESVDGCSGVPTINYLDNYYHLYTIKDAKDGDVMICGNQTFLFKCIEEKEVYCYGYIWRNEYKNQIGFQFLNQPNQIYCYTDAVMSPATKKQRDTLFAMMKEAGYSWDADKKELKKIEQEETELPKGEDYAIDGLWQAIQILEHSLGEVDGWQSDDGILEHKCAIEAVKRLYKQKHTWSEEDEKILNEFIESLRYCNGNGYNKQIDWLKSLKDRI